MASVSLGISCGHFSPAPAVDELTVPGDSSAFVCAAVSPSNLHVAACTDDKTLAVWKREREEWAWQGKR